MRVHYPCSCHPVALRFGPSGRTQIIFCTAVACQNGRALPVCRSSRVSPSETSNSTDSYGAGEALESDSSGFHAMANVQLLTVDRRDDGPATVEMLDPRWPSPGEQPESGRAHKPDVEILRGRHGAECLSEVGDGFSRAIGEGRFLRCSLRSGFGRGGHRWCG